MDTIYIYIYAHVCDRLVLGWGIMCTYIYIYGRTPLQHINIYIYIDIYGHTFQTYIYIHIYIYTYMYIPSNSHFDVYYSTSSKYVCKHAICLNSIIFAMGSAHVALKHIRSR